MIFTSLQENLKTGISIVGHIAGKNINLPILNNILFKVEKGNIELVTTDLEIGITHQVRGKAEKEGGFTVDAKVISDYINLLPNKIINIKKQENKLKIKTENYSTTIHGQPTDDYPLIPKIKKDNFYQVNFGEFRQALSQVIFSVANTESRIELSGVLFDFKNNDLILVATDSYRLAEKKIKIKNNNNENKKIIVPAKTILELMRILSITKEKDLNKEVEVKFYISDNQILFTIGNTELISRLIDGQYPDYKQIIPNQKNTTAILNKEEFLRAVKASSIFSKTGVYDISLDFPLNKNKTIITSSSSQTGESITEINSRTQGKDNGIVINFRYLIDGLNSIDSENVIIEIMDSNTPCILKPEKNNDYLYIIMPIKQ